MSKCAFCPSELTTGDIDGVCASCRNAGFGQTFQRRSQPLTPFGPPQFPPSFPPQPDYPPYTPPTQHGWMCPNCGTVYAPFVRSCGCSIQTRTSDGTQLNIDF